jgi:S-ribosylhomocysteine lyase
MKTIPCAEIDYNTLKKGIYINRIDDDITTYDIRMKEPNREQVLTNSAIHTIEHIAATYLRNTEYGDNIVYFGPMGSRTGFYLLTRRLSDNYSIGLIKDAFQYVAEFWGRVPGASPNECGNCLEHNLPQAKEEAKIFLEVIKDWTKEDLEYPVSNNSEE